MSSDSDIFGMENTISKFIKPSKPQKINLSWCTFKTYFFDKSCLFGIGCQWIGLPFMATGPCGEAEYQIIQVFLYRLVPSICGASQSETHAC